MSDIDFGQSKALDGTYYELGNGFSNRFYPQWVIEIFHKFPLCTASWEDAHNYYDENRDLKGDVGGINFRAVRSYPEDLRVVLGILRERFPNKRFRMVVRVEAQKVLDF